MCGGRYEESEEEGLPLIEFSPPPLHRSVRPRRRFCSSDGGGVGGARERLNAALRQDIDTSLEMETRRPSVCLRLVLGRSSRPAAAAGGRRGQQLGLINARKDQVKRRPAAALGVGNGK